MYILEEKKIRISLKNQFLVSILLKKIKNCFINSIKKNKQQNIINYILDENRKNYIYQIKIYFKDKKENKTLLQSNLFLVDVKKI